MALNPVCVCNHSETVRVTRRPSRITRNARYFPRNRVGESAVHLLRSPNSNLPFSNPRRARPIHALAVPATAVTLVSRIFGHLGNATRSRTCPFSLGESKDRRDHRFVRGIPATRITIIFFSPLGNPSSPCRSIFYTGHSDTGQETLTIFFFFSLSPPMEASRKIP